MVRGWPGFCARCAASHAFVHGFVGQAVRLLIVFAEGVADGKPIQLRDQLFGASVQVAQRGILYFVDAFDLANQQLGIADQFERLRAVLKRVFESTDQALVLGEIVGLVAEIFAESCDFASGLILDDHTVAGRAGVAAGAAVAVGDEVVVGSSVARDFALGEKRLGCGTGRIRGHAVEFTTVKGLAARRDNQKRKEWWKFLAKILVTQAIAGVLHFVQDDKRSRTNLQRP